MFAALDFSDFFCIWIIGAFIAGGVAVSTARLEAKIDLILRHLGLTYQQPVDTTLPSARRRGIIVGIIAVALLLGYVIFQWLTGGR